MSALTGDRIRLRELRDEDLPDLVAWWQDPDVLVTQTSGPMHPRPADAMLLLGLTRNEFETQLKPLTGFDSRYPRAMNAMHSAFDNPLTGPDTPARHSIEARFLAFYE